MAYTTAFNNHYMDFIEDIQKVFPEDEGILVAKNLSLTMKKSNPKILSKMWKALFADKYRKEIDAGDIRFFISNNFDEDIKASPYATQIMECINRLREPVQQMSAENKQKVMQYIINLTKLSDLCSTL